MASTGAASFPASSPSGKSTGTSSSFSRVRKCTPPRSSSRDANPSLMAESWLPLVNTTSAPAPVRRTRASSSRPTTWKDRPKCQSEVCNNRIFLRYRLPPTLLRHHPGGVTEVKSGQQWLLPALAVEEAAGLVVAGGGGRGRSGGGGDSGQPSVIEAGAIHIGFRKLSGG